MAYVVHAATEEDIADICALVNSSYRGDSSRAGWTTEAEFLEGQRTDTETLKVEMRSGKILCLREDDQLLGCVYLEPGADVCYLGMLTIRPDQQNTGLGRVLLERAEAWARRTGAKRMTMAVVHLRESLIAWYTRRGYVPTGETKPWPYGDDRFGVPLRDDLHFIVLKKDL